MAGTPCKLEDLEAIAIAGVVKATAASKAKAALKEQTAQRVRLTAQLDVLVTKGTRTQPTEGVKPVNVALDTADVLLALLAKLGIGPKRMAGAMAMLTESIESLDDIEQLGRGDATNKLRSVIEQEAASLSARLPAQPWSHPGRAAAVRTDVLTLKVLESETCPA